MKRHEPIKLDVWSNRADPGPLPIALTCTFIAGVVSAKTTCARSGDGGVMALKKALYYGAIAIAVLIGLWAVFSIVLPAIGIALTLLRLAIQLAVLAGIFYCRL